MSTAPVKLLPHWCLLSVDISTESLQRLSEGFGTSGVGDGVGQRFLWVAAVVINLEQDGKVHADLQQAACPELHGSLGEQKVARFKGVTAGPHQHHLDTHALCGLVLIIAVELWCAQHCFSENSQEAQGLHEQCRVQEEVGDVGCHQREGHHALHVVRKVTPRPKVVPVKVQKEPLRDSDLLVLTVCCYEGASFGVEFSGHADVGAQVEHDQHGGDHDDALPQQQRLEVAAKSEEYPQDVCHQEDQAHIGGEALCILRAADVSVLGDVGHHPTKHHGTSSHPRHQRVDHGHNLVKHFIFHVELLYAVYPPRFPCDDFQSVNRVTFLVVITNKEAAANATPSQATSQGDNVTFIVQNNRQHEYMSHRIDCAAKSSGGVRNGEAVCS